MKKDVKMAPDCIGAEVRSMVGNMKPGDVVVLENLRFHPEEQTNEETFGKELAANCDIYINDAFAVSHRVNASVVSITQYVPVSAAGLLLEKELEYFKKAMAHPVRPLVAIIGGAKISSKLAALENMLQHVDKILIGGAMANTFLKYNGCDVGKSMIEEDLVETAGRVLRQAAEREIKCYLPVDVVVAEHFQEEAAYRRAPVQEIPSQWMVMDIGPASTVLYGEVLQDVGTIIWNGPMGVFEMAPFSEGTTAIAHAIAQLPATSIVGGGETGSAVHQAGVADKITYISTGGGAFLSLMEGKKLPAIAALEAA
jgi:phosphoglycerate kinase